MHGHNPVNNDGMVHVLNEKEMGSIHQDLKEIFHVQH